MACMYNMYMRVCIHFNFSTAVRLQTCSVWSWYIYYVMYSYYTYIIPLSGTFLTREYNNMMTRYFVWFRFRRSFWFYSDFGSDFVSRYSVGRTSDSGHMVDCRSPLPPSLPTHTPDYYQQYENSFALSLTVPLFWGDKTLGISGE